MPQENEFEHDEDVAQTEQDPCDKPHVEELDESTKCVMSTFATIRSKIDDLARAESDFKRFELSIDVERKRLQKQLDAAKVGLRNARVQIGAELAKVDAAGFSKVAQLLKEGSNA